MKTFVYFHFLFVNFYHFSVLFNPSEHEIRERCDFYYFLSFDELLFEYVNYWDTDNYLKSFDMLLQEVYPKYQYTKEKIRELPLKAIHLCNINECTFKGKKKIFIYIFIRKKNNEIKNIFKKTIIRTEKNILALLDCLIF